MAGLFKKNGFRTEGTRIFFSENHVLGALETAPSEFTIHARNPEHTLSVGGDHFILLPTGGAPHVVSPQGVQRDATLADFIRCCKLVQTSDQVDMGGYIMVQPNDVPPETAHLDMLESYITLCDKPIFGASGCAQAASDTIELAGILFNGKEKLKSMPVMTAVVNAASPLQYSREQAEVIVEMARYRQPVVIANMILAGASGPVSMASLLTLENAELLAGLVLSQLAGPGTPMIYGSTSAPMDMKTMVSAVGAPETLKIASATIQMAGYYNLPCRTGGGLTDAHMPDGQAMAESALMISLAVRSGAHVIYHACGQMGSYISMSFEKWIMDEEVCRNVRQMIAPVEITEESLDIRTIKEVGIGGQYLTHASTFERYRSLSSPVLFNRKDYTKWQTTGGKSAATAASKMVEDRIAAYEQPPWMRGWPGRSGPV